MGYILSIVALLLLLVAGAGCALLLLPKRDAVSLAELAGLSVILGAGFVAATSFALGFALSGLGLQIVVGLGCLGMAALGARSGARVHARLPRCASSYLPWIVFSAALVLLIWLGRRYLLGWDSLVTWEFKARIAALNGGSMPLSYYLDSSRQWSHPEYPLLLPLTEAWLFDWAGQADERLVRLLFDVFDAALLLSLYVLGSRLGGSRWNGTLAMGLLLLVPQLIIGTGGTTTGWTDYLVGLTYLLAAGYLVQALLSPGWDSFGLVAALSAVLVWTKQEGAILWICIVLTTVVLARGRRVRAAALVTVPALLVVTGWRLFIQMLGVPLTPDFLPFTGATLLANINRVPELVQWTVAQMGDQRSWGLFWPGLAVSVFLAGSLKVRPLLLCGLLIAAPLGLYMMTFVFSAWVPYTSHVESAMPRLMEQLAPLGVLAIATAAPGPALAGYLRRLTTDWLRPAAAEYSAAEKL